MNSDKRAIPTPAQEEAATKMLRDAFGALLAVAAPGSDAVSFWGPRIAEAVVNAGGNLSDAEKDAALTAIERELGIEHA